MTVAEDRARILKRPGFRFYEDLISNKFGAIHLQCVNDARRRLWVTYALGDPNYEKKIALPGLALPAGTTWGANGKLYILDSTTTPALTADLYKLKKLWIVGDSSAITVSKSTFDSQTLEGTGIPNDTTILGLTDVYHELIGEGATQQLLIFIGTTAAGSAPKVFFEYAPTLANLTDNTDELGVPGVYLHTLYDTYRDDALTEYLGTTGRS